MLNLDVANKEFIEIEVVFGGETHILKLYKQTGNHRKKQRVLLKQEKTRIYEIEEMIEEQFFERLEGKQEIIDEIKKYYDENGGLDEFRDECELKLGKLKKKA